MIENILQYLLRLTPKKALLHITTTLCLVLLFRYAHGDYDDLHIFVHTKDVAQETVDSVRKRYGSIFLLYEGRLREILAVTGGKRISLFIYHTEFELITGDFKALNNTLVETVTLVEDVDRQLVLDLFANLPVAYNEELDTFLRGQCFVHNPSDEFYLEGIIRLIGTERFVAAPVKDLDGKLVGFITMSFYNKGLTEEELEKSNQFACDLLKSLAEHFQNNIEFIRAMQEL